MAISLAVPFNQPMRPRLGVPHGLNTWRVTASLTGDVSGDPLNFVVSMSPDLSTRPESYVITSCRLRVFTFIAAQVSLVVSGGDWIEGPIDAIGGPIVDAGDRGVITLVRPEDPLYLSQITPGTDGTLTFESSDNPDGLTTLLDIRGFWAEKPFVVPTTIAL